MTSLGKARIESPIPEKCVKIHPNCTKEIVVFRLNLTASAFFKARSK